MVTHHEEGMKSYAIYVRTWDDDGPDRGSDLQIKACVMKAIALASERGETEMDVDVIQEHHPGIGTIRPGLDEVRDSVAKGKVSAVVVYDPEVLAQGMGTQIFLVDDIESHGCRVYFAREGFDSSPEGRFFRLVRRFLAKYCEEKKRVKSARKSRQQPKE
jgi:DNA invertase Pin-like site-specific DNA recombinase